MAVKYVKSTTGSDSNGGTSWADAYATVGKALSVNAAGDTVYVSQVHAESSTSAITWTSPGTAGNPVRILCVNDGATPPTSQTTGATVTTATNNVNITFGTGYGYVNGISFIAGSGSSGTSSISTNTTSAAFGWVLDTCPLRLASSGTGSRITLGAATSVPTEYLFRLINCTMQFNSTAQGVALNQVHFEWYATASAIAGATLPTSLFIGSGTNAFLVIAGVDLSALGTGKNLVSFTGSGNLLKAYFRNCKLGASVSAITGTIPGDGSEILLENADSGNTNYRMERYTYQGSVKHETTHVRTSGGASDGTTALSHNFTSLTTGPTLFSPLYGPWMTQWNETTGSSITVTVEACTENVVLTNADAYLEVEYLGTSSFPESIFTNSRVADVFTSTANLTTSAVSWSGFSTAKPQSIALSFTPQIKGLIRARLCLVKANATVYVDPQISVGSGPSISRSMMIPGGTYHNETATGGGTTGLPRSRVFTGY